MERLWAPWREKFILCEKEPGCFLCRTSREKQDRKNLILFRGEKCFVILNRYPYNNGHLMIAPFRHVGRLEELRDEELTEIWKTAQLCVRALKSGLKPKGINLGMNLGKVSGAGVGDHIHLHLVPRWQGDTNFMPIFAETKVVSVGLADTYRLLKKEFKKLQTAAAARRRRLRK
ncbi:MAG: HIT domain-containing protein [Candidatus Zixiibacteriota bacterium]